MFFTADCNKKVSNLVFSSLNQSPMGIHFSFRPILMPTVLSYLTKKQMSLTWKLCLMGEPWVNLMGEPCWRRCACVSEHSSIWNYNSFENNVAEFLQRHCQKWNAWLSLETFFFVSRRLPCCALYWQLENLSHCSRRSNMHKSTSVELIDWYVMFHQPVINQLLTLR